MNKERVIKAINALKVFQEVGHVNSTFDTNGYVIKLL